MYTVSAIRLVQNNALQAAMDTIALLKDQAIDHVSYRCHKACNENYGCEAEIERQSELLAELLDLQERYSRP